MPRKDCVVLSLPHLTPEAVSVVFNNEDLIFVDGFLLTQNSVSCGLLSTRIGMKNHRMLSQPSFSVPFPTVSDVTQLPSSNPYFKYISTHLLTAAACSLAFLQCSYLGPSILLVITYLISTHIKSQILVPFLSQYLLSS